MQETIYTPTGQEVVTLTATQLSAYISMRLSDPVIVALISALETQLQLTAGTLLTAVTNLMTINLGPTAV